MWLPTFIDSVESITTNKSVASSTSANRPPERIVQSAFLSSSGIIIPLSGLVGRPYVVVLDFAEIDPNVTASGQRTFNVEVNGVLSNRDGPIDVFARAGGAYDATSYTFYVQPSSPDGDLFFNFSATANSRFAPFVTAYEFFRENNVSSTTFSFQDDGES
ncbi:hypothetical protein L7F22_046927 [Adiantum nelumboides]|nr:hypothetical protein [Adiantum nelumboides]MCO5592921.1 hypothetical protein [Adiantum nelumboides]MCO5592923.1 hypothetical protein [Adiantum nelumboides]